MRTNLIGKNTKIKDRLLDCLQHVFGIGDANENWNNASLRGRSEEGFVH
jgi:hypothetical protein